MSTITEAPVLDPSANEAEAGQPSLSLSTEEKQSASSALDSPVFVPPSEEAAAGSEGITAWHNDKKITSLWTNSSPRNSWVGVQGMGWRRINNANDSSFQTMTCLLSLAEQTGAKVRLRIESDNKIHEVYVF